MAVLVAAVTGTLGFFAVMLTFGGIADALALNGQHPRREGIELVLFPLGVVATSLLMRRLGRDIPVARRPWAGPLLPLLAAPVVPGIALHLWSTWEAQRLEAAIGPERLLGAAMIAAAAVAGTLFFPRIAAAIAGAIAVPTLFALLVLPIPTSALVDNNGVGFTYLALWFGGPLALVYASWRMRGRPLSHAMWVGAITLFLGIFGYGWAHGTGG